ncbi:hypothetical protein [Motilibacter aurantiacus]|uniref:hypothetical protein n=1 Tax=Motilibacter aurantiacus TaxID=2714955 RepID=UPI00140C0EDB|nr:hypothetical protein [Motilibacter aurantiacus]
MLAALLVAAPIAPADADTGRPRLATDAVGPLFALPGLVPGREQAACVQVSYAGLPEGSGLGLFAAASGTGLADHLELRVERGTGGRYGDCTGFTGIPVFSGTLAGLATAHGTAATAAGGGGAVAGTGAATYRITLALRDDDRAQGRSADATFAWATLLAPAAPAAPAAPPPAAGVPAPAPAVPGTGPAPGSAPGSAPAPATGPGPVPGPPGSTPPAAGSLRPTASPSVPGGDDQPTTAPTAPTSTTAPSAGAPATPRTAPPRAAAAPRAPEPRVQALPGGPAVTVPLVGAAAGSAPAVPPAPGGPVGLLQRAAAALDRAVGATVSAAHRVSGPAATGAAVGIGTLPLLGGFLLVQRRLDARDPKLALAPLAAAPDLPFDDRIRGNDE